MSTQQQIIDAVEARLKTITQVNGYQTNFGSRVYVWRGYEINQNEVPCILVNDTTLTRDIKACQVISTQEISIIAVTKASDGVDVARKMGRDIAQCLAAWPTAGGLAISVRVPETTLLMEQHETVAAAIKVICHIQFIDEFSTI